MSGDIRKPTVLMGTLEDAGGGNVLVVEMELQCATCGLIRFFELSPRPTLPEQRESIHHFYGRFGALFHQAREALWIVQHAEHPDGREVLLTLCPRCTGALVKKLDGLHPNVRATR